MTQAAAAVLTLVRCQSAPEGAQALAVQLAAGSRTALAALYDLYADRVYGLALWVLGDPEDAADATQDAFVRVWEKRGLLARASDPTAYLLRIARSVAVSRLRRRRGRTLPLSEGLLEPVLPAAEELVDAERLSRLIARLPIAQRVTIYLHVFAGLSFREIGRATGVPTFTAASRYRLARRRLRGWLEP